MSNPEGLVELHGVSTMIIPSDGPPLAGEPDLTDLIGQAMFDGAELVVIPTDRLADEFFSLRTGVAGGIVQKFVNYRLRLAIVGDISAHVAASTALRDFVIEANRGRQLWFTPTFADLEARLL
jgi:hypothetical protein